MNNKLKFPALILTPQAIKLKEKIAKLETQLTEARQKLKPQLGESVVHCEGNVMYQHPGCGAELKIKDLIYIDCMVEMDNYDRDWTSGEGMFLCPSCNKINRLWGREEVMKLNTYFKNIEERYPR